MATASISLTPLTFSHFLKPSRCQFLRTQRPSLPFASPTKTSAKKSIIFCNPRDYFTQRSTPIWLIYATSGEAVPAQAIPLETSQQVVSTSDQDGVSITISVVLFIAFVGLSVLTIGVIYLGVTDLLQKREREKLERDEAANQKKNGKI